MQSINPVGPLSGVPALGITATTPDPKRRPPRQPKRDRDRDRYEHQPDDADRASQAGDTDDSQDQALRDRRPRPRSTAAQDTSQPHIDFTA